MSRLYYRTAKKTETGLKVQALKDNAEQIATEIEKFVKSLGAKSEWAYSERYLWSSNLAGVEFAEEPDLKKWKVLKHYEGPEIFYVPRRGSKENIKRHEEFYSFKGISVRKLNECVGFSCVFRSIGFNMDDEFFYFITNSSWEHEMPEDCIEITTSEFLNVKTSH